MSPRELRQVFTALNHKDNRYIELALNMLESGKVFWALQDANTLRQQNNDRFLLPCDSIKQARPIIAGLQIEHAIIARVAIFNNL